MNDFYNVTLNTGELLYCYLTENGMQSLDGTGRVFMPEDIAEAVKEEDSRE